MTTEAFANAALSDIVEGGTREYEETLRNTDASEITDPYWQSLSDLYSRLSTQDRETLIQIMRQSQIDALATLFAATDGITRLQGQDEDVSLVAEGGKYSAAD